MRWRDAGDRALAPAVRDRLVGDGPGLAVRVAAAVGLGLVGRWVGPAYVFALPPMAVGRPPGIVRVGARNAALLAAHFACPRRQWRLHEPCLALVEDGAAVAVCMSARHTAAAEEASLNTVPAWRGRGHGAAVARARAQAVQAEGRVSLYSTAADNVAALSVARRLGQRRYGIDVHID